MVPARAETCGNVTERGLCQDAKTLLFCKGGTLQSMRCPQGELCAHDDRFGGAAGCIATRYTGCGAVTEAGLCAGDTLLYCEQGRVEELVCPDGTTCGAVVGNEGTEFDCVVQTGTNVEPAPAPEPVEPGTDDTNVDEGSPIDPAQTMGPSVERGGAPAEEFGAAGGAGCAGGGLGGAGLGALWALVAMLWRGVRARRLVARRSPLGSLAPTGPMRR